MADKRKSDEELLQESIARGAKIKEKMKKAEIKVIA
jgi:hypothetical protein